MKKKNYTTPELFTVAIETKMLIAASINTSGSNPTITINGGEDEYSGGFD